MNDYSDVLLVVLGWLLGTLSPSIGRAILRGYRQQELLRGLRNECLELRFTVAPALWGTRSKLREMDLRTVQLVKPIVLEYTGADDQGLVTAFRQLAERDDQIVVASMNERGTDSSGQWPMPYDLPLLEAHLGEMTLLPMLVQEQLGRIRAELRLFNEQVAYVRHLLDLTFELTGSNHAINASNLVIAQRNLGVREEALVRTLSRFLAPNPNALDKAGAR